MSGRSMFSLYANTRKRKTQISCSIPLSFLNRHHHFGLHFNGLCGRKTFIFDQNIPRLQLNK